MSKYKGLFTFDIDNHRYIPIGQADGIIDCFKFKHESKEHLIKDEKARKLVLAWAECCCVPLVKHYLSNGLSCFICNDEEGNDYCLDFTFCINNLEAEHIYSVKEL